LSDPNLRELGPVQSRLRIPADGCILKPVRSSAVTVLIDDRPTSVEAIVRLEQTLGLVVPKVMEE
jgi:hypothetical protein